MWVSTKVAIHETKRAAAKCQNPNSSYRIMPEWYPSRRVHLQRLRKICRLSPRSKHTSTAPLRAQCVACGCLTANRGPPKRSLLYSLHDIYTSQITHNFFYNEKKKNRFHFPAFYVVANLHRNYSKTIRRICTIIITIVSFQLLPFLASKLVCSV